MRRHLCLSMTDLGSLKNTIPQQGNKFYCTDKQKQQVEKTHKKQKRDLALMKKNRVKYYKVFAALALCPMFWACSEEEIASPPSDGALKNVQMLFAMTAKSPGTRMGNVEGNAAGIVKDLSFIPYQLTAGKTAVTKTDTRFSDIIPVGSNYTQNTVFRNFPVPVGTNAFLVYGVDQNFQGADAEGKLSIDLEHETNAIQISPVSISPKDSEVYNNVLANTTKLNSYLTAIANTEGWSEAVDMKPARDEFLGLKAGSSKNVLAAVQDLYDLYATATEGVALALKNNILSATTDNGSGTLSFKEGYPTQHPMDYGLPAGSAAISWDAANNKFINAATTVSPLKVAPSEYYAYPAALWYHANTGLRTSEQTLQELFPNSQGNFDRLGDKEYWQSVISTFEGNNPTAAQAPVTTETEAIVLVNRMQYGVARLDLRVNAQSNDLIDNAGATIHIADETTFPLTGILVGGQRMVDFAFQQFENVSPQYTMYDKNVTDMQLYHVDDITTTKVASTLVLESKKVESGDLTDSPFTFALEFENNSGHDFVGVDKKIIAPGCKFYLIGSITPKAEDIGKPVYEQDKITALNITVESLVNAYYIIPDLRNPQLRVGVTVDDWILSTPTGPIVM